MKKPMLEFVDGGMVSIDTDKEAYAGCETCDYGSEYIDNIEIVLTKYKIKASVSQMYEYVFTSGDLMKIILTNITEIQKMTEKQFCDWFEQMLKTKVDPDYGGEIEFEVTAIPTVLLKGGAE